MEKYINFNANANQPDQNASLLLFIQVSHTGITNSINSFMSRKNYL